MVLFDESSYFLWYKAVNRLPVADPLADFCAADVYKRGVEKHDGVGQGRDINVVATPRINGYAVVFYDFIGVLPTVEGLPVVASYEQCELVTGVLCREVAECAVHIRRLGEVVLHVGNFKLGLSVECRPYHLKADIVIEKRVVRLKRILRRHDKPHLVQPGLLKERLGKGYVAVVEGVEGAAVDADGG